MVYGLAGVLVWRTSGMLPQVDDPEIPDYRDVAMPGVGVEPNWTDAAAFGGQAGAERGLVHGQSESTLTPLSCSAATSAQLTSVDWR